MKKTNRLVTIFLMVCMVLASGGLLYATMYASGAGTQSTQTTVAFDAPSGIRYNELTGAFEVFSAVGVSWIGSNGWVSTLGNYNKNTGSAPSQSGTTGAWYQATRTSTYNIMCDIAYKSVFQSGTKTFVTAYNAAFNNGITLEEGGKIYGRGFYLSGFPVRNVAKSSALIATNNGIIRNINIIDAHFNGVIGTELTSVGILCAINDSKGVLDECGVYGEYSSAKFPSMYGIAAENSGTIMNCSNNAKLINSGIGNTYTAGIAEVLANSNIVNNKNNGALVGRTPSSSSAGIAFCKNDVEGIISGNTNNAVVSAVGTATGVLGGLETFDTLRISGNENNGELFAEKTFFNYYGQVLNGQVLREANPGDLPVNGIRWNADLGLFEVYNSAGVSHISMGFYFNGGGLKSTTPLTGYEQATMESHYKIMNDIVYNASEAGFNQDFATVPAGKAPRIGVGGIVDGGGYTLSGFPVRNLNENVRSYTANSAFLLYSRGTLLDLNMHSEIELTGAGSNYVAILTVGATGKVIGCSVSGSLDNTGISSTTSAISGVIGWAGMWGTSNNSGSAGKLEVSNCFSTMTFNAKRSVGAFGMGGSEWGEATIIDSVNFGAVTGAQQVAGFVKNGKENLLIFKNCVNYGKIYATGQNPASGFAISALSNVYAWSNCINYGNVTGGNGTGGIIAWYDVTTSNTYVGMQNHGNILDYGSANYAGSIIGKSTVTVTTYVTLQDCKNYGGVGGSISALKYGAEAPFAGGAGSAYHNVNGNISVDPR